MQFYFSSDYEICYSCMKRTLNSKIMALYYWLTFDDFKLLLNFTNILDCNNVLFLPDFCLLWSRSKVEKMEKLSSSKAENSLIVYVNGKCVSVVFDLQDYNLLWLDWFHWASICATRIH